MKKANVLAADPVSRLCDLEIGSKTYHSILIPYNLNYLSKGYRVLFDEDENIVIAIIGIPDQLDQDPLGTASKDVPTSSDFKQSENIVEGDYFHNVPEAGYIGLLRGFVALFGSSPLSQIMLIGTKKLARIIAANLDVEGGENFHIRIHTNDGKLPPQVDIKLGQMTISSDTKTTIRVFFANLFEIMLKQESYIISIYNPATREMDNILTADYSNPDGVYANPSWNQNDSSGVDGPSERVGKELYFALVQKLFIDLSDVVVKLKKMQVSMENLAVTSDKLSINGRNSLSLRGKVVDLKSDAGMNISGGNVKINVAPSGAFIVGTSGDGGIKVDPIMVQISSGKSGIQLNGAGDFMVNGLVLQQMLTTLLLALGKMAALIPLGPAAGPGIPPVVADLGVIAGQIPVLLNPLIRHGKAPMPVLT